MANLPLATPLSMRLVLGLEYTLDGLEVTHIEEKSSMLRSSSGDKPGGMGGGE